MVTCPACGLRAFHDAVDLRTVEREIRLRSDFVASRLRRRAAPGELKDLLDFMHGFPVPLLECAGCGLLARAESRVRDAAAYQEDANDLDVLAHIYPRFVQAFRNKETVYRDRLRPHANVLEVGSHVGGFLQVAEEWNWTAFGLDVGRDTTEFIRSSGLRVRRELLEHASLPRASFDAVFVWNCFEQIEDPAPLLSSVRRVLKPHGLLVVRVPNALSWRILQRNTPALAYNNLLGFPYLYGYSIDNLNRILVRHGFSFVRGFNSELLTTPFADLPEQLRSEQERLSRHVAAWSERTSAEIGTLTGPWIEVIYRRMTERDWQRARPPQSMGEVPRHKLDGRFLPRAA